MKCHLALRLAKMAYSAIMPPEHGGNFSGGTA
jgi:hypothetical protein